MENERIIRNFYEAFARRDAEGMIACYDDRVEFSDPAFGSLKGAEAKNMWKMLLERGGDIKVEFKNVAAAGEKGAADWTAEYVFSRTGRKVFNEIHADFEFAGGKITRHTDDFNFWKWSRQALGLSGLLLGWTPFLQKKFQRTARQLLREYSQKSTSAA